MDPRALRDPLGAHQFLLELDHEVVATLLAVRGLAARVEVFTLREGGGLDRVHMRPGPRVWGPLELVFGVCEEGALASWRGAFRRDPFAADLARSGAVVLLDDRGDPSRRWDFVGAWPVAWEGPRLEAREGALATETVVLAHEGLMEASW
jgi:phage tail-like protein